MFNYVHYLESSIDKERPPGLSLFLVKIIDNRR